MTEFGPIARTVTDAALLLDVLAGTTTYRDPRPPAAPLRIAFSAAHPSLGVRAKPAVRRALDEAMRALAAAGHQATRARVPYPPTLGMRFTTAGLPGSRATRKGCLRSGSRSAR